MSEIKRKYDKTRVNQFYNLKKFSLFQMYCVKILQKNYITPVSLVLKAKYSRRSAKNTNSYKLIKTDDALRGMYKMLIIHIFLLPVEESINDVLKSLADMENTEFGVNPNWELLAPRGFRFYMPGSVGPGWLDETTTAQVETRSLFIQDDDELSVNIVNNDRKTEDFKTSTHNLPEPMLRCIAQECPTLLRKSLLELFPGCVEVASPQLTIVTISQKSNCRAIRWSKEVETEKLAKFVSKTVIFGINYYVKLQG